MKKYLCVLLTVVLLVLGSSACTTSKMGSDDDCSVSENTPNVNGIELFENSTELEIDSTTDDIHLTQDSLLTNSTKITVTANNVAPGTEIEVFLYLAHDTEHYIATAILSSTNKSVDFTNLTSSEEYKIGATTQSASESTLLTITD